MKDALDVAKLRKDFPVLAKAEGKRFAYLDTAASSQTPVQVLEAQDAYYFTNRANVHRGMYGLSERATEQYEAVRRKVADLIRANEDEIVFTRGATEGLNLVAHGLGPTLGKGDEVVMTIMEHHANLLPWQQQALRRGFTVKAIPLTPDFRVDLDAAARLIGPATKVVAVTAASNVLGTVAPVAELAALARKVGAVVVVDAAQLAGHQAIDVRRLDCDFLAFSGHKMLGPTGTGVLYGKKARLEALEPMLYGGDMIREVYWDRAVWNDVPWKFEAGTPNIGGVIGLGAAVDYVRLTGIDRIEAHEHAITAYLIDRLAEVPGAKVIGPSADVPRTGAVSFTMEGMHPHDVSTILDAEGVCVRGGHHCAMPLLRELGIMDGVTRASVGLYTTKDEIDLLIEGLRKARRIFKLD